VQKAGNWALVTAGCLQADVNLLRTVFQAGVGLFFKPADKLPESLFGVRHSVGSVGFLLRAEQGDFEGRLAHVNTHARQYPRRDKQKKQWIQNDREQSLRDRRLMNAGSRIDLNEETSKALRCCSDSNAMEWRAGTDL